MDVQTLATLGGALGLSGVLAAIVSGIISRKKLKADATLVVQQAASGLVESMQKQLEIRDVRLTEMSARIDELEDNERRHSREAELWRRDLQLHATWDALAMTELAKHGVTLPEAPPLYPA